MHTQWINHEHNPHLILFFNGWGMDANTISQMNHTGFDVLMVYNYTNRELILPPLHQYQSITLVAWSMGVWAAAWCGVTANRHIAINGTPTPMDAATGINPAVFTATHQGWSEASRQKFNWRVAGGRAAWTDQQHLFPNRAVADQKLELEAIATNCSQELKPLKWDRVIIGTADAIFLPANQHAYWDGQTPTLEVEMPHWPFRHFNNWHSIIAL